MPDETTTFGVILFHTSSAALRAEKLLLKAGLPAKLIPVPREFSSDCGIALRFDWNHTERAQALLETARVEISSIHAMQSTPLNK
jgi:hypothetical protein